MISHNVTSVPYHSHPSSQTITHNIKRTTPQIHAHTMSPYFLRVISLYHHSTKSTAPQANSKPGTPDKARTDRINDIGIAYSLMFATRGRRRKRADSAFSPRQPMISDIVSVGNKIVTVFCSVYHVRTVQDSIKSRPPEKDPTCPASPLLYLVSIGLLHLIQKSPVTQGNFSLAPYRIVALNLFATCFSFFGSRVLATDKHRLLKAFRSLFDIRYVVLMRKMLPCLQQVRYSMV